MRAPADMRARVGSESDMPMKYHDITTPIYAGMPVYEGDPPVEISLIQSIKRGDSCNVSRLLMGAHTGTHVDAANHFIDDTGGVDEIPFDTLIGPVRVIDLSGIEAISADTLAGVNLGGVDRLLFKTSNSRLWNDEGFRKDSAYLTGDAAERLVEAGVKLVGMDYLSIEKFGAAPATAHLALLGAGVVILEGINLSEVEAGEYGLICLPLPIKGCDGSPCRAVLEMPEG
jgi:arylformamidase